MKRIFLLLGFLLSSTVFADQISLYRGSGFNPLGYVKQDDPKLQLAGKSGTGEFDITYMFGESFGSALGIEYGAKYQNFTQRPLGGRPQDSFESVYEYYAVKVGAWLKAPLGPVGQFFVTYGKGDFEFYSRNDVTPAKTVKADFIQAEARVLFPIVEFYSVKFDLSCGVRIQQVFVPGFEYKGISYQDNEVDDQTLNLSLGVGLRY